eukprot:TRINITY_DN3934_c0_g1_i1.p1 TRINITY_DN3934_c0_g1~~TRINITY_DN3934_c0_g1_i1.p1  ORF type:complete len:801 (+),score=171.89 TRINITY_DN3934_c0_g1_i1:45-2447(+)
METGRLIQLLSLFDSGEFFKQDVQEWAANNPRIVGDYGGEIGPLWALNQLALRIIKDDFVEELVEAVTRFAAKDSSGIIMQSDILNQLGDLIKTADMNLVKKILDCFHAIVQKEGNCVRVAEVAGLSIFNLNRSDNIEVAEAAQKVTNIILQNEEAAMFMSNSLALLTRSDIESAAEPKTSVQPPSALVAPNLANIRKAASKSQSDFFGKGKSSDRSSSPAPSSRKKDQSSKNPIPLVTEDIPRSISTAIDISRKAAHHINKIVTGISDPSHMISGSPDGSQQVVTDGVTEKKEEIWWKELEPPGKIRAFSLSLRKLSSLGGKKPADFGDESHTAKQIHELLLLWERHYKIVRGIQNEYISVVKNARNIRLQQEFQNLCSIAVLELDSEKQRWRKLNPEYEEIYGANTISEIGFTLSLSIQLLYSQNEEIQVMFAQALTDFISADASIARYAACNDGIGAFCHLLGSSNPVITKACLRTLLIIARLGHHPRKAICRENSIPRLAILASADSAEIRKLAAKIIILLADERKYKDKVFKDPNMPAYLTLTSAFMEYEEMAKASPSIPTNASNPNTPGSGSQKDEEQDGEKDVEFRKRFNLPDSEKIQKSYSCGLVKQIPIHGRLWISSNYLCFYSGIIGLKTMEIIPISHVKEVNKSTHKFINPAIEVVADGKVHMFTSFYDRDRAYAVIRRVFEKDQATDEEEETVDFLGADDSKYVELFSNQELSIPIDKYFSLIHGDESIFCKEYHESRGDMEFTVVPWRTDPALGQIRELRYIVNTNAPIGPQTAQVLETQRYVHRKE